jgi:hypothetical protein
MFMIYENKAGALNTHELRQEPKLNWGCLVILHQVVQISELKKNNYG